MNSVHWTKFIEHWYEYTLKASISKKQIFGHLILNEHTKCWRRKRKRSAALSRTSRSTHGFWVNVEEHKLREANSDEHSKAKRKLDGRMLFVRRHSLPTSGCRVNQQCLFNIMLSTQTIAVWKSAFSSRFPRAFLALSLRFPRTSSFEKRHFFLLEHNVPAGCPDLGIHHSQLSAQCAHSQAL